MKNKSFIKGALILVIFNLVGKVIGAVYRIPLARILGAVGMGQYQLTFPLYCLLLTISTSGIPVAISKMVAEFNSAKRFKDSKRLLKISILILVVISLISSVLVVVNAKFIAKLQGNINNFVCYYGIAPAILFVGVVAAFRGYFQGNLCMFPTAISGLIEQVVKMALGLFFANKLIFLGTEYAVFGALFGVSISEFVALLFLIVYYLIYSKKHKKKDYKEISSNRALTKQLLGMSVPITLGGLVGPFSSMIDSLLAINLLMASGFSNDYATTLLGLQSGVVEPLINIPIVIAVSISTALLPSISRLDGQKKKDEIKQLIEKAFQITLSISLACTICFVIFGKQILNLLYGSNFNITDLSVCLKLLFVASFNIVFLSLVQVTAGVLQGLGKSKIPVKSLLIGVIFKVGLNVFLISVPSINILGAVIAGGVCYFLVFLLNYRAIKKQTGASLFGSYFHISLQECFVCVIAFSINLLCLRFFSGSVSLVIAGVFSVLVFFVSYYWFFLRGDLQKTAESKIT